MNKTKEKNIKELMKLTKEGKLDPNLALASIVEILKVLPYCH